MSPAERLQRGLEILGLELPGAAQSCLLEYCELLRKWSRVFNLTALRSDDDIITRHLLDSLSVLPYLNGGRLADVGSGGGLPGIPLAIARPDWAVSLLDSSHKKASFLTQARIELGLLNVCVCNQRIESWIPRPACDVVISRALSDLAGFVTSSSHALAPGGRLHAMKGLYPHEEIDQMPPGYAVERVMEIRVPFLDAPRHLVTIAPVH
jgi:16S rRNA (guanine527-N7)-methyltransferase